VSNTNTLTPPFPADNRIQAIDILRGFLIVLMALDHVRDFFLLDAFAFSATDPEKTTVALFATRWITHLCAPGFVWLSGVSAYMYFKKNGPQKTSAYLFSRGIILILLELTIVKIGWHFNTDFSSFGLLVIWALGLSMILLGLMLWLPQAFVFITALVILAGHNLLDTIQTSDTGWISLVWHILHQTGTVTLNQQVYINVLYPVLPMFGLICLGYTMGHLFTDDTKEERITLFKRLSLVLLLAFISIRLVNMYGDPSPWMPNQYVYRTVFSFFNVTKYPMSLDYTLITLSALFYILTKIELYTFKPYGYLALFGKVSMFFYIIHIYVIHILAVLLAMATNHQNLTLAMDNMNIYTLTNHFGYSLPVVYLIWLGILLILYPVCKKYRVLKSKHPDSFLKFL
jgi:uncharacterized membrane protein